MPPPTGRRPGRPETRAAIVRAATAAFGARGYDGVSVRAIAADAGVDPALISHYFGGKAELFLECVQLPIDPRQVVDHVLAGPIETAGGRLVELIVGLWDSPAQLTAMSLLRSAVQREESARLLREFLLDRVLRPLMARLATDPDDAAWRAALIASQVAGLLMARFVLQLEPLASASPDRLAAAIGPTLQRYLTGDVARLSEP